jgi:hypothetical protein
MKKLFFILLGVVVAALLWVTATTSKTCFDYKTETECTSHKQCRWFPPHPNDQETMDLRIVGCNEV